MFPPVSSPGHRKDSRLSQLYNNIYHVLETLPKLTDEPKKEGEDDSSSRPEH